MANAFIKNYFGFNRQQRNGLYVLVLISFLLLVIRLTYPMLMSPGKITVQNLPLIERKLESAFESSKKTGNYYKNKKNADLFVFDPNTVSHKQLIQLGFSEKRAAIFLKFRERGFVFKKKEDLQKVFGISGSFYETLAPYIIIVPKSDNSITVSNETPAQKEITKPKRNVRAVELNQADSAALETLNGIGPAYAKRIVKYRAALGGYVSVEQLKEVYGLTEELFEKIRPFVSIDPSSVKKLNLNTDDFKTINKHPYLSYELTKSIFNFRRKTPLTTAGLKELVNDDALYQKLLPYLAF